MVDIRTDLLKKSRQIEKTIADLRSKHFEIEVLLRSLGFTAECYRAGFDPREVESSKIKKGGNRHVLELRDGSTLEVSSKVAESLRLLYGIRA